MDAVTLRPGNAWVGTGVQVRAGESITILSRGSLWVSESLGVGLDAAQSLWRRIGSAPVSSMASRDVIAYAETTGELQFLVAEAGRVNQSGGIDPAVKALPLRGALNVVAIRWGNGPENALPKVVAVDPELFGAVHSRLLHPRKTPPGWSYHPRIGAGEIFAQVAPTAPLNAFSHGDVGILTRPAVAGISEDLVLSWSWRVHRLPSRIAEDLEATHDYFAVALEFDDGRDLSWMWSATLDVGTVFPCPLAYWDSRETHVVVRTGTADLGSWVTERRVVHRDVAAFLPGSAPAQTTAAWLVANTAIQGDSAAFEVRDLRLESASQQLNLNLTHNSERPSL
ncbi:hypothetical protein GCM10027020_21880 [Nocardioides salsibiostraticola]